MSPSKTSQPEVYLVTIDELPEGYTWRDLKDFVRPEAAHQFWVDLQPFPAGTAMKKGCVRTQRYNEAWKFYVFLARSRPQSEVMLWNITASPPKIMAPDPTKGATDAQIRWTSQVARGAATWSSVTPSPPGQGSSAWSPQEALTCSMGGLTLQQRQQQQGLLYAQQQQQLAKQQQLAQQQQLARQRQLAQQQPQQVVQRSTQAVRATQAQQSKAPYYCSRAQQSPSTTPQAQAGLSHARLKNARSPAGMPINVGDGVAQTESRGVFISGMSYRVDERDIIQKFARCGKVVDVTIQIDKENGKSKGIATVLFSSAAEARNAVETFNEHTWLDKKLRVRLDRETTTVVAPGGPLIVNGSRRQ